MCVNSNPGHYYKLSQLSGVGSVTLCKLVQQKQSFHLSFCLPVAFLLSPSPVPSPSLFGPFIQAMRSGCKLPQHGLGRAPAEIKFGAFSLKYDIWWQQFQWFSREITEHTSKITRPILCTAYYIAGHRMKKIAVFIETGYRRSVWTAIDTAGHRHGQPEISARRSAVDSVLMCIHSLT